MKSVLVITETRGDRDKYSGYERRRENIINAFKDSSELTELSFDVAGFPLYNRLLGNELPDDRTVEVIRGHDFVVVVSTTVTPYRRFYLSLSNLLFVDLADSAFHAISQLRLNKIFFNSLVSVFFEVILLRNCRVSYLGGDEINCIPRWLRENTIKYSYPVLRREPLFDSNGPYVFIGNYSYPPNLSSARILSKFSKTIDRDFVLAGPNLPRDFDLGRVKYLGVVSDTSELFRGAAALIYPEKFGTGVKTKVLESWGFGIPVVGRKSAFTNLECDEMTGAIVINSLSDLSEILSSEHLSRCSAGIDQLFEKYSEERVYSVFRELIFEPANNI